MNISTKDVLRVLWAGEEYAGCELRPEIDQCVTELEYPDSGTYLERVHLGSHRETLVLQGSVKNRMLTDALIGPIGRLNLVPSRSSWKLDSVLKTARSYIGDKDKDYKPIYQVTVWIRVVGQDDPSTILTYPGHKMIYLLVEVAKGNVIGVLTADQETRETPLWAALDDVLDHTYSAMRIREMGVPGFSVTGTEEWESLAEAPTPVLSVMTNGSESSQSGREKNELTCEAA